MTIGAITQSRDRRRVTLTAEANVTVLYLTEDAPHLHHPAAPSRLPLELPESVLLLPLRLYRPCLCHPDDGWH